MQYDAFISYAHEDKDEIVRPLATMLQALGATLWYDEFSLVVGDSLRSSIDKGLTAARYGVVILSPKFFAKSWTNWELDGLVQRHLDAKESVILPVWHNIQRDEIARYSPSIANIVALNTSIGMKELATKLMAKISPDSILDLGSLGESILEELHSQVKDTPLVNKLLEQGVYLGDLLAQVAQSETIFDLLQHYYRRGTGSYDPDNEGVRNMIADYDIGVQYARLRRQVQFLVVRPANVRNE